MFAAPGNAGPHAGMPQVLVGSSAAGDSSRRVAEDLSKPGERITAGSRPTKDNGNRTS